jgi:uncharacterized protein YdbL (DUF1318 family)
MTRTSRTALIAAGLALVLGATAPALAQSVETGLSSGTVGEQSDGYLGFAKPPSGALKAEVDAINIKRRQAYTQLSQTKNVAIEAVAASVGCSNLGKVQAGRSYSVARGVWAVKGASPVALPPQCGG